MLTSHNKTFSHHYDLGIWWSMNEREGTGIIDDGYFVENFKTCMRHSLLDGNHDETLFGCIGFYLGMIHGGLLTSDFKIRDDATTLVALENREFTRGYEIGRSWAINEAYPEERTFTDVDLIGKLKEFANDGMHSYVFNEGPDDLLYWYIGCRLGELSTNVFPQH
jgi:hypothetical protein